MAPHGIDALVSRQVLRWQAGRKALEPAPAEPCVAISRLPWSGGGEIARRLAERLDYGLFDREIIDEIEHQAGIQHQLVEGVDERVRSVIDRYVGDAFRQKSFAESDYLRHLVRMVRTLGARGQAVILGRGAPFVLPADVALRLLVVAPEAYRAERLAKAKGLGADSAREQLAREDERRSEFAQHQFGVDQSDPLLYDLVLNSGTLSTEGAVGLVIDALRDRFPAAARARSLG